MIQSMKNKFLGMLLLACVVVFASCKKDEGYSEDFVKSEIQAHTWKYEWWNGSDHERWYLHFDDHFSGGLNYAGDSYSGRSDFEYQVKGTTITCYYSDNGDVIDYEFHGSYLTDEGDGVYTKQ